MTLVYARIADRTALRPHGADRGALTNPRRCRQKPKGADDQGVSGRWIAACSATRYCVRPVELDCQFESIYESCTFFMTTTEFKPT